MSRPHCPKTCPDRLRALREWCAQPLGRQLAEAEQQVLSEVLGDVFGYHLVVVDPACSLDSLGNSRVQHQVVQSCTSTGMVVTPSLLAGSEAMPWQTDSIDAFVLPHVLEVSADPHQVLREIDRCLVGEGHLILSGFNPLGLWGLRRLLSGWRGQIPWSLRFISLPRLKDWLSLLGFDTLQAFYLFPRPPWYSRTLDRRLGFMDRLHRPHRPLLAACYLLVARKRVVTLTPVKPRWRPRRAILPGVAEPTQRGLSPRG